MSIINYQSQWLSLYINDKQNQNPVSPEWWMEKGRKGKRTAVKCFPLPSTQVSDWKQHQGTWKFSSSILHEDPLQITKFCPRKECLFHNSVNFMGRCSHFLQHNTPRSSAALKSICWSSEEEISWRIKFCQAETRAHTSNKVLKPYTV